MLRGSSDPCTARRPTAQVPTVYAHRGSSAELPEHTLDAYQRAIEQGADGLECDVRLTRDGHLVCIHDRRLDRTSNGRGLVSTATLAELDELDFASWHPAVGAADRPGVLTLDRLLDAVTAAGRPLELLVETKHPTRYRGSVERALLATLARYGLGSAGDRAGRVRISVMSFSLLALRRMRALAPHIPTVFLFEWAAPLVRQGRAPYAADALGPSVAALRAHPSLVPLAHARGRQVFCWTVNTAEDIELVLDRSVDGVISDRPAAVLERLGRRS
jgi:glycerophosphoryl diester phosphodiesterase